jgi:NTE family protein
MDEQSASGNETDVAGLRASVGQIVLVFQGGGALGAYQAGVYEALHEAGIEPDWIIGTSIGAINASLIAGNAVENRLGRLREFWGRLEQSSLLGFMSSLPGTGNRLANMTTVASGVGSFFTPNPFAFFSAFGRLDPERAGYYSTSPLKQTLTELVDFDLMNKCTPRLTVGAANVSTGDMHYFDSRNIPLEVKHILASGALPPAFPAVRIDGELYWDGGILSNTPVEAVFDDNPRRNSLVFSVHIWHPRGPEPRTIWDVLSRQKDIQYSSRTSSHIARQKQMHSLRHIITELASHLPKDIRANERVRKLASYGCVTRMHVVRLVSPAVDGEDHTKDIDFSRAGIRERWSSGLTDTRRILAQRPWVGDFDPLEGFILHEQEHDLSTMTN